MGLTVWKDMKYTLIFVALFSFYAIVESQDYTKTRISNEDAFASFVKEFNKEYADENEKKERFDTFVKNRARIIKLNKRYINGLQSFSLQLNQFSDMTMGDFKRNVLGLRARPARVARAATGPTVDLRQSREKRQAPLAFDWRRTGAVVAAQNQGFCGSSYSFAATAAIESRYKIASGNLVKLSEQQAISCSRAHGSDRCRARTAHKAFRYFMNTEKPVALASVYPYTSGNGVVSDCDYNIDTSGSKAQVAQFVNLHPTEDNLIPAVYNAGPVAAHIEADHFTFVFYSDGVYNEPNCANTKEKSNHWVLIVGYGTTATGQKFWGIKNSFGETWGSNGFAKLSRDVNNTCCIACNPTYPVLNLDLISS
jgi:cathepsin L